MLQISIGIVLIVLGSLALVAALVLTLSPPRWLRRIVDREPEMQYVPVAPARIERPIDIPLRDLELPRPREADFGHEAFQDVFAELLTLRTMVADLSREVRLLRLELDVSRSDGAAPAPEGAEPKVPAVDGGLSSAA